MELGDQRSDEVLIVGAHVGWILDVHIDAVKIVGRQVGVKRGGKRSREPGVVELGDQRILRFVAAADGKRDLQPRCVSGVHKRCDFRVGLEARRQRPGHIAGSRACSGAWRRCAECKGQMRHLAEIQGGCKGRVASLPVRQIAHKPRRGARTGGHGQHNRSCSGKRSASV